MNPILLAYLLFAALGAVLLAWGVLFRLGVVPEPGTPHRVGVAVVSGVLFGLSTTIFLPVIFLTGILLGAVALLALHYRGEGRWLELGLLLISLGITWTVMWGLVVLPPALSDVPVAGGWVSVLMFGAGVAILSLGVATLVLKPAAPPPDC